MNIRHWFGNCLKYFIPKVKFNHKNYETLRNENITIAENYDQQNTPISNFITAPPLPSLPLPSPSLRKHKKDPKSSLSLLHLKTSRFQPPTPPLRIWSIHNDKFVRELFNDRRFNLYRRELWSFLNSFSLMIRETCAFKVNRRIKCFIRKPLSGKISLAKNEHTNSTQRSMTSTRSFRWIKHLMRMTLVKFKFMWVNMKL